MHVIYIILSLLLLLSLPLLHAHMVGEPYLVDLVADCGSVFVHTCVVWLNGPLNPLFA